MKLTRSTESQPVPEGIHIARVFDVEEGTSNAGNPKLVITFEIEDTQRRLKAHIPTHVSFRVDELMDAFCDEHDNEMDSETLLDKGCRVEIVHEKFDGKTIAKVEKILAPEEGSDDTPF